MLEQYFSFRYGTNCVSYIKPPKVLGDQQRDISDIKVCGFTDSL